MLSDVVLRPRTLDGLFLHVKRRLIRLLDRRKALCYKDQTTYGRISEDTVLTLGAQGRECNA
jgi:hypothetical protein